MDEKGCHKNGVDSCFNNHYCLCMVAGHGIREVEQGTWGAPNVKHVP